MHASVNSESFAGFIIQVETGDCTGALQRKNSSWVSYYSTVRRKKNEGRLHWKLIQRDFSVSIRLALMEDPTSERLNPLDPLTAPQPV